MSESTSERKLIKENIKNIKSLVKEIVFTPLYILASFVKDKVSMLIVNLHVQLDPIRNC